MANKTSIEWCDFSINPIKGLCPIACDYCYARRMYKRFKWNPYIRADWQETGKIPRKPSKIFVGSTMELFGDWIKPEWMEEIFKMVKRYQQHTFIFLTKKPENLIKYSPYPDNCWIGVSATKGILADAACARLSLIEAPVKFISIEPLLEYDIENAEGGRLHWQENYHDIDWIIIGQQTPVSKSNMPKIEWIRDIVEAADKASIPVFLKDNLKQVIYDNNALELCTEVIHGESEFDGLELTLRQEFPQVKQ